MDLVTLRRKVVELSGRDDLVDDLSGYGDNGVDFHIRAGLKYLDTHPMSPKPIARHIVSVAQGSNAVYIQKVRSVHEVWAANSDGRYKLTPAPLDWLREEYPKPLAETDQGAPLYWSPAVIGLSPEQYENDAGDFTGMYDWDEIQYGYDPYVNNGIIWMPPTDGTYTMQVWGTFFSRDLTADTDVNWWTTKHSELVVYATLMKIEEAYRNTQGANDWRGVIEPILFGLDQGDAYNDSINVTRMEG